MKLSDHKLKEIQGLSDQQFWPLIKQQLDVVQICYIIYALQVWQDGGCIGPFQKFFDEHKTLPQYGNLSSTTNYRMMSNAPAFGFIYPYKTADKAVIAPAFKLINKICKSDFSKIELYKHIVDAQLEKLYTVTEPFKIHTVMFLLKILLTIGDITGQYSISYNEMKLFVVTSKKWSEFLMTVDSILRYREDEEYKKACDKELSKFENSRYNNLVKNISYVDTSDSKISIIDDAIRKVRIKVAEFENLGAEEVNRRMNEDFLAEPQSDAEGNLNPTLQQIVYGAPGSGKSHKVKADTKGKPQTRITFHPDTDYSSFVGAYKPVQDGETIKYSFAPQQFATAYIKAWKLYISKPGIPYYFIIEEINRGNCAQIFGDIFQLLDRDAQGFSEYPIDIDNDLADFIYNSLTVEERQVYNKLFPADAIINGKCTRITLPPNFHILATMNTSDQSLFPMDSAFKRRWEWVYVPIDYEDASKTTIYMDDKHQYNWGKFIIAVNERIFKATGSPDKQLGNRFVQIRSDNSITPQQFIGKVLFYLWEEVFKDNKKYSIFDKETDFFKIHGDITAVCKLIENLGVKNIYTELSVDNQENQED